MKRHSALLPEILTALEQLENDTFDPGLRTHKLQGDLAGFMSCSVAYDLRIVFRLFDDEGTESILLLSIGTHDEVY